MDVSVTREALEAMRAAANAAHPLEACGILFGKTGCINAFRETKNVHPAPHTHFEIEPRVLIDAHRAARTHGPAVMGYFHSHPRGPATPSATDIAMAHRDGCIWAIAGSGEIAFWCAGEHGFDRVSYDVLDP